MMGHIAIDCIALVLMQLGHELAYREMMESIMNFQKKFQNVFEILTIPTMH